MMGRERGILKERKGENYGKELLLQILSETTSWKDCRSSRLYRLALLDPQVKLALEAKEAKDGYSGENTLHGTKGWCK